jgi:hypothetical protein
VAGRPPSKVIRAASPPRSKPTQDGRETLWQLYRDGLDPVRAELVALTDAVEVEIFSGTSRRRQLRFLRDSLARAFAERVRVRLARRGFVERRNADRPRTWG